MKKIFEKIKYRICKNNLNLFIKYLRKHGCKIGENVHFHDLKSTFIDINRLGFIEIGDNCNITMNVIILAHDYSYKVCRNVFHDMPQKSGITKIGKNVFIGMNSIILMGSEIGDNVIVGAGSVVSGKIPNNCVVAGNPARVICSLEEYHNKCVSKFEENAKLHFKRMKEMYGINPSIESMGYYCVLFLNKEDRVTYLNKLNPTGDDKNEVIKDLMEYNNKYRNFEEFIKNIGKSRDE